MMNAGKSRGLFAMLLLGALFVATQAVADNGGDGFRRGGWGEGRQESGDRFGQASPEQRQFQRERREALRERWQQMPADERQKLIEQRRQARQLSPDERRQLRRDILEANRGSREERGR